MKTCMYICTYVCIYVCMNVFMYVWMYLCMYVCMLYVCMHACMYACMFILNFCASNMNSVYHAIFFFYFGPVTQTKLKYYTSTTMKKIYSIILWKPVTMTIIMIKLKVNWTYHLNFLAHAAISNQYSFSNSCSSPITQHTLTLQAFFVMFIK